METRRDFLLQTSTVAAGAVLLSSFKLPAKKVTNVGMQLYTVRKEMLADATGTFKN